MRHWITWLHNDSFSFIFPGKILTDDFADKEGLEMGDEYFANLDHIESVENFKEGYESEAHCSDSDGSGVDLSRIKIQPSALVSAHSMGHLSRKGNFWSHHRTTGDQDNPQSLWLDFQCIFLTQADLFNVVFFSVTGQSSSSSGDSDDDDDRESKSEDESDSSDDTFVKENYYSSSSVWRSYTTRGQLKGNKEGETVIEPSSGRGYRMFEKHLRFPTRLDAA